MKIFNRNTGIGLGIGIGIIGLTALLIREKEGLLVVFPVFTNFFGGASLLSGYPRGIRNNNPGNIELTQSLWKGEIPQLQNTDGRFKQFYSYTYGVRAAIINLRSYFKKGICTPRQIISRWAPPLENNTEGYIRFVAEYIGKDENTTLRFEKHVIQKLIEAIIIKENGKLYLNKKDFDKAWEMI